MNHHAKDETRQPGTAVMVEPRARVVVKVPVGERGQEIMIVIDVGDEIMFSGCRTKDTEINFSAGLG
jgi:hypothetical protein